MQLKYTIRHEISCIHLDMLYAVANRIVTRLQTVICGDGDHKELVVSNMFVNNCVHENKYSFPCNYII